MRSVKWCAPLSLKNKKTTDGNIVQAFVPLVPLLLFFWFNPEMCSLVIFEAFQAQGLEEIRAAHNDDR